MSSVATRTVTVNAAFLQEIKEVNQELWLLLERTRQLCTEPERLRAGRRPFVVQIAMLRDNLAMHFALEEAYGYFDDPVVAAPHLSERAEQLRREHKKLYLTVCELVEYVEGLAFRGRLAAHSAEVCQRFSTFCDQLDEHEANENDLILQAYDEDIGVGD